LIGCVTDNGIEYITKLEDFRDLVSDSTYDALKEFVEKINSECQEQVDDLQGELNSLQDDYDSLDGNFDDLQDSYDSLKDDLYGIISGKEKFETVDELLSKLKQLV
jgi:predicted nuclease with TOPRIM domain